MRPGSLSIKWLFPGVIIALVIVINLIVGPYLSSNTRDYLYTRTLEHAGNLADSFFYTIETFRGDFHTQANQRKLQRVVENISVLPGVSSAYIISPERTVLANSRGAFPNRAPPEEIRAVLDEALTSGRPLFKVSPYAGVNHLILARPVLGGVYNSTSSSDLLAVGILLFNLAQEDAQVKQFTTLVLTIYILSGLTFGVLIFILVNWRIRRPLEQLEETVSALGRADFEARASVPYDDELGRIAKTLNQTLDALQDVTVSKRELEVVHMELLSAQAQIHHSSKMAALGEMAGGISHEINNPLATIHGKIGQMKDLAAEGKFDRDYFIESAEKIENTVMRISKIIRSLRSFAREGTHDPMSDASVATIVSETLEFCRERFRNRRIELRVDPIPSDLKIMCRGIQISQVLLNLLNNAHDAVENLPEKWVRVSVADLGSAVAISVTDSGNGIPAEIREKILQPFFTTKEAGKGTGLGLSVSQGIVASHHGLLYLDTADRNTRFIIRLPKKQPTAKSGKNPAA